MTDQEVKVIQATVLLWEEYLKLPKEHPDDDNEFRFHVHGIQKTIMCRTSRRNYTHTLDVLTLQEINQLEGKEEKQEDNTTHGLSTDPLIVDALPPYIIKITRQIITDEWVLCPNYRLMRVDGTEDLYEVYDPALASGKPIKTGVKWVDIPEDSYEILKQ